MGLSIHSTLRLARTIPDTSAQALVCAAHQAASRLVQERGLPGVRPVLPVEELPQVARWVLVKLDAHTTTGIAVPPLVGWGFSVTIGDGCEPAIFGLCRYPAHVRDPAGRLRRTRLGHGWSFAHACKTQYASLHGWDHFLRCHRAVIDLALLWATGGVAVTIEDEGLYWPGRDEWVLRIHLDSYNQAVAGLAGALKDAADLAGGPPVEAPILAHPQFERLEAEGVKALDGHLGEAMASIKRAPDASRGA
jgi:hypothetical protein